MMINEIMQKIWQPITKEYQNHLNHFLTIDSVVLFENIKTEIKTFTKGLTGSDYTENILATPGCPHKNRHGQFSGCCMCNWETENVQLFAKIAALRQKNQELYIKILLYSFEYNRGLKVTPSIIEEIATHDAFDENTFPDAAYREFFDQNLLFKKKPMYGQIAARASNITEEKLKKWKSQFRKQLMVGMGVEVGNEWLRNHWINKDTSDAEIKSAISAIKNTECHITADILLGIPGLSYGHSLLAFLDTCDWLLALDLDNILISPLTRKEFTLQDFIYRHFAANSKLQAEYIVNGYLTGIPTPFVILEGLYQALVKNPELEKKIILSPQNFKNYLQLIENYYVDQTMYSSEKLIINLLKDTVSKNLSESGINLKAICSTRGKIYYTKEFQLFLYDLEKQMTVDMKKALWVLAAELCKSLWPESYLEKLRDFEKELQLFNFTSQD